MSRIEEKSTNLYEKLITEKNLTYWGNNGKKIDLLDRFFKILR